MADKLTIKQERFAQGLFAGKSQREAYRQAFNTKKMSDNAVDVEASNLANSPKITLRLDELTNELKERNMITVEKVLNRWWDIATADPNEIIHIRRVCCRHCYGQDHKYQWRDQEEYQETVQSIIKYAQEQEKQPIIPGNDGGYGYNRLFSPHAECPYCSGEGTSEVHIEDTRKLSPKAKVLIAGVKQTNNGIEIKMQDQGKALENVARHLGMFIDRSEVKNDTTVTVNFNIPRPKADDK